MSAHHPSTSAPGTSLRHATDHRDATAREPRRDPVRAVADHPSMHGRTEHNLRGVRTAGAVGTPPATPATRRVRAAHLAEPPAGTGRTRRRAFQRCSAVVATLMLGATQCEPVRPDAIDQPAGTTTAGTTTAATTTAATTTLGPTHPASGGADVPVAAAVVHGPEGTAEQGRCTQFEQLLTEHAPPSGWDVQRMSRIAWRESNCWPAIRSRTSDTGLLQINDINLEYLTRELGEPVDRHTLTDPVQNVRAAAALCTYWARNGSTCYQPWEATDR